ncbi:GATA transcription factor 16-like [Oryza glaberrima]|uniref:GATA-type domain-containing protein n=2 Tax=Oryza TaxID=4527 RepID=A0A0D3EZC5_9ORYZ|nr:GATA transcription factor 16-like [Oryza glaberrima]
MDMDSSSSPVDKVDPDECNGSKACADCHTTKTPLWRGGPGGPKSLCNACGIRYRKRRRAALGLDSAATATATDGAEQQKKTKAKKEKAQEEEVTMELHTVGFRSKDAAVLKQRRRMRRRKCLGEEERAAILLMALSSGVIYA